MYRTSAALSAICFVLLVFVNQCIASSSAYICYCPEGLGRAVSVRLASEVKELLDAGANPNCIYGGRMEHRWTPLYHAALLNHVEVAEILLEAGADPLQVCVFSEENGGESPFKLALFRGYYDLVDRFVAHGISLERILMQSVSVNDLKMVECLSAYGVDVTAPYTEGSLGDPISHAKLVGHEKMVELLTRLGSEE